MPRERIGIMGGSFNPIHERHLDIAVCALKEQELNRIIFLPTGNPPHKREGLAEAEHRYEMTRLMVSGSAAMSASREEIDREGVIYTVDTLARFKKQMPNAEFFYIIGEDTLKDLPNWRKPDKVFSMCRFIVCARESENIKASPVRAELEARGARFSFLSLPPSEVSSTSIREALARGEEPDAISPLVLEYIRIMGLYGVKQSPVDAVKWYPKLKQALSEKRLTHSLLVSHTSRELARVHGVNEDTAACAALLHDCAKCMPIASQQKIAKENKLLLDKAIMQSENLLHGPVGAFVAENDYGVTDPNVLSAIRCHTTGRIGMLPLDLIVYLADKIEPSRRPYPALDELRELAKTNLIAAVRRSLDSTLEFVKSQNNEPNPVTRSVAEWLGRLEKLPKTSEDK